MYVVMVRMAISAELGTEHSVDLPAGMIRYRSRGAGPPVVFVHGLLVNADLWRGVVPAVSEGFRCIAPDWPLGSHSVPVGGDLSPSGVAALIGSFLDALDLEDVTIVANDSGGALTQLLMVNHPARIGRVLFTPSDCFERFFPQPFTALPTMLRAPGMTWAMSQFMRIKPMRPLLFGTVAKRPIAPEILDSYLGPASDARIRADLRSFVTQVHRRYTLAAAEKLRAFDKPVLLAWATEDKIFPLSLGRRLHAVFPDARFVEVADSYTFVPEDQPVALAELITEFAGARRSS
jgi:pimeloyl-ACP methyl ester carboxylesterase